MQVRIIFYNLRSLSGTGNGGNGVLHHYWFSCQNGSGGVQNAGSHLHPSGTGGSGGGGVKLNMGTDGCSGTQTQAAASVAQVVVAEDNTQVLSS